MLRGNVRPPAVAGMFYPGDPDELRETVDVCLGAASTGVAEGKVRAVIAPHAGYIYSGPIAGTAFAAAASRRHAIRRVILLGPSHRVGFRGVACSSASAFATPLGPVPVDPEALASIQDIPCVICYEAAHSQEHSLEVHLPFLQRALGDFRIVPLVVGDARPEVVAGIIERLWDPATTLVSVSSDLSHYLSYAEARRIDRRTSDAIERLDPDAITFDQACGRIPIQGLLIEARKLHLHATTADLRNSGDTAGDRDRVVGYGAYVFTG